MASIRLAAILALTSLAAGQALANPEVPSNPKIGRSNTPKPELPVVDDYACPGKGRTIPNVKIDQDDRIYPSWSGKNKSIGTLKAGEQVTVLGGANVTREPGTAIIKYVRPDDEPSSLKVGGTAFVYGLDPDQNVIFWADGTWFAEWVEAVAEKDQCGFGGYGPGLCTIDIIKDGKREWWAQVKTSKGITGWVLAERIDDDKRWYGNFSDLCHYGED